VLAWIGAWLLPASAAGMDRETKHDFEVGAQGSLLTSGELSRARVYGFARHRTKWYRDDSPTTWRIEAALRGYAGTTNGLDPRAAFVERADDHTNVALGLQEIVWGETFGLPIADLVHPRDLRDPLLYDMDWMRLPVPAANGQLLFDNLRLQSVAVPIPRNNMLPKRGTAYDPFPPVLDSIPVEPQRSFPVDRVGRDGEYGGRASYLFGFGLDVALLYYFHWNRTPVYELQDRGTGFVVAPVQERVHATGLTFSQAFEHWVLRGDFVVHPREPVIDDWLGPSKRVTHVQGVLGADMTTEDQWTIGFQTHYDYRGIRDLWWWSALVRKSLLDGKLEPQVFLFVGADNTDTWIQPRVDWHVVDAWTLSLRADLVWGTLDEHRGDLGLIRGRHRVMGWTSLRF
jgi:hypothetical protein